MNHFKIRGMKQKSRSLIFSLDYSIASQRLKKIIFGRFLAQHIRFGS